MKISKNNQDFINTVYRRDAMCITLFAVLFIILGFVSFIVSLRIYTYIGRILIFISIAAIVCGIIFLACGLLYTRRKKYDFQHYIETFSFSTENTVRGAVLSFPDPIVVVNTRGIIKWYNPAFVELCGRGELFGVKIQDIFPAVRLAVFLEHNGTRQEFSYCGRDFIITGEVALSDDEKANDTMIGLSFADISEITRLNKKLDEERCVVCTAIIDNYDEVFKETPNSNHGPLIGDIERCVGLWVEKGNGFYRRYERDKFIILFEAANFELLLNEKFTLLNEVKEINQQNKIPVTLSIGVGAVDGDLKENDRLSQSALDMALGRGGDQAVVKNDDGYIFFGAKSLGVEKTTKVKARVVAKSLCNLIDSSSNVIIMGHKNSDFDSLGAAVGLFRAAADRDKPVYIAMDKAHNNANEILRDLYIHHEYAEGIISFERAMSLINDNSLLIIVDTHRPSMVEYPELLEKATKVALIDHHRRSEEFIDNALLSYHEPYASSTCEMVAEVLQYMSDESGLSVHEAEALYSGIYLDTKGFTFKTGARTFEAAAYLRKMGVDPVGVHKMFRNDLDMYIQKSKVISAAKVYRNNIAIAVCDEPNKNVQLVVAQAADDLLDINGIEASFVLANVSNRIVISGRSLGAVNVQVILEKLGGGGHSTIAGAQLENSSLTIAELKLHNAIDEVLFE